MFLIDTNVISESRKARSGRASPQVLAWLNATDRSTTFISTITLFELELGVVRIERRDPAQGKKLRHWLDHIIKPGFAGRTLPMKTPVAEACATLRVPDPVSERDGWIAATALVQGLTVITRNVTDFEATGLRIIDPWKGR